MRLPRSIVIALSSFTRRSILRVTQKAEEGVCWRGSLQEQARQVSVSDLVGSFESSQAPMCMCIRLNTLPSASDESRSLAPIATSTTFAFTRFHRGLTQSYQHNIGAHFPTTPPPQRCTDASAQKIAFACQREMQ